MININGEALMPLLKGAYFGGKAKRNTFQACDFHSHTIFFRREKGKDKKGRKIRKKGGG